MDRDHDRLVDELPEQLAVATRLHEAGQTDDVIGLALGIPPQSVPMVLKVARLKLTALSEDHPVP
ncbi:MAG TPA: hypothetical protein VF426_04635 [Marmoricola sp.]